MKIGYIRYAGDNTYIIPETKISAFEALLSKVEGDNNSVEDMCDLWNRLDDEYSEYVVEGDLVSKKIIM